MLLFLIVTIIVGGLAGFLARLLVPGPDPMGVGMTIVLGIVGSFVLWARRPRGALISLTGLGQGQLINETWAREVLAYRELSRVPLEVADGDFYINQLGDPLVVGDPIYGASLEGDSWVVRSKDVGLRTELARLVLIRPPPSQCSRAS